MQTQDYLYAKFSKNDEHMKKIIKNVYSCIIP